MCRELWDEKEKEMFRINLERIEREENMQSVLRDMGRRIRKAMEKTENERRGKRKKGSEWWNEECGKKKRLIRRSLRK